MNDTPFPKNPYVIGVPLTGDAGFYGRRAVFTFVEDTLDTEQQNVIVLYGQRRVGKTSLLHQLARRLRDSDVLPIHFDLQGRAQHSLGQVLYELARTIARPLKMNVAEQTRFDNAGHFFSEEFLPSLYKVLDKRRLLLLFDEFDVLGDELTSPEAASETLFPYLQKLIMHERQIVFIFVVGRRIEELATHFQAIFKQAIYRRVGLLKPEDARTLIVEPVKEVLAFEEGAVEAIFNLTAGHPYFTQLICFELFNAMKAKNQRSVAEADVFKLVNQAIESGYGALTWFWDGLPRAERFIMSAVAHVTDETGLASKEDIRRILEKHRIILTGLELTDAPDRLVEWEMLRREGSNAYRFVVELVRRWIIKAHPLESARRDVDFISQRAVRSYENARDAHMAGDLEYARDEYQRTLAANPNHSGGRLGLAQVLFELGQIEAAIEEFTKAYALDEMSARDGLVRARLEQGKKLEEVNQPNEAMLQYEQALQISPTDEITRQRLSDIWRKRGDTAITAEALTTAYEAYQKTLDFDQNEVSAKHIKLKVEDYTRKAITDSRYDDAIEAIQQLQKLGLMDQTELNSRLAAVWLERGHAALAATGLTSAVEAYQQALMFDPQEVTSRSIYAKLEEYAQQAETSQSYDEAIKTISHLRQLLPEDKNALQMEIALWSRRGDTLVKERDNAGAIKAYQRALELTPGDATLIEKLQAISAEWEKLLETDRIFNKALIAHQDKDWLIAQTNWLQLLKMDILEYKNRNIATMLAEANEKYKRLEPKQPTLLERKSQTDHNSIEVVFDTALSISRTSQDDEIYNTEGSLDIQTLLPPHLEKLALISADNMMQVKEVGTLKQDKKIQGVVFSPNGKQLAIKSPQSIQIWDVASWQKLVVIKKAYFFGNTGLTFSPDSSTLASAGYNTVQLWNAITGKQTAQVKVGVISHEANCIAFNPDGSHLAIAGQDGKIRLWIIASGKVVTKFKHDKTFLAIFSSTLSDALEDKRAQSIVFSPDGENLAVKFASFILVWSLKLNKPLVKINTLRSRFGGLAFSPDGKWLTDGVSIWDSISSKEVVQIKAINGSIRDLSFSSDGKLLVMGTNEGKVYILDLGLDKGKIRVTQIGEHKGKPVQRVAINSNGQLIASVGEDDSVRIWGVMKE